FFQGRSRHPRLVSDWSSDVCSPDLAANPWTRPGELAAAGTGQSGRRVGAERVRARTVGTEVAEAGPVRAAETGAAQVARAGNVEIGRASCRERGERAVGGVAWQRKK